MTKENDARIPKPSKIVCHEDEGYQHAYNQAIDEYEKYHNQEIQRLQSVVLSETELCKIITDVAIRLKEKDHYIETFKVVINESVSAIRKEQIKRMEE